MTRTHFVGGNWKMNTNHTSAAKLAGDLVGELHDQAEGVEIAVFPPFPYLITVGQKLLGSGLDHIKLGAQDVSQHPDGAFTGEVSAAMLLDCGVKVVLVGHSERRHVIGETDAVVNAKLKAALAAGLDVILCVGETLEQREAGQTDRVNKTQITAGLKGVSAAQMPRVTIAYEPVWAIGTGKTATPEDAQNAHKAIRDLLAELYSGHIAEATRIQYGGSMKPGNAAELVAQPDIDGGLIGGASLKPEDFARIVQAAAASPGTA